MAARIARQTTIREGCCTNRERREKQDALTQSRLTSNGCGNSFLHIALHP